MGEDYDWDKGEDKPQSMKEYQVGKVDRKKKPDQEAEWVTGSEPKKEKQEPQKVTEEDLFIKADNGFLGENSVGSSQIYRIRVENKNGIVEIIDETRIQCGYGIDRQDSIRDFLRRNKSWIIERVFNANES